MDKKNNKFRVDFIGIGAAKSGTTWIAAMLDKHPGVCMSEPKEVNYFNYELNSSAPIRYGKKFGPFLNKNYNKPLSWYKKHFWYRKTEDIVGEFSPVYFYDSKAALKIKETFPDAKLIVVLRNPINRAYSEYWMFRSSFQIEKRSFDKTVREKGTMYIEKGLYYKQLSHYLKYFNKSQILIVFFDDIKKNPVDVLKKIHSFIGVDDSFVPAGVRGQSNYAKASRVKGAVEFMNNTVKFLINIRMGIIIRILKKLKINKFFLRIIAKKISYSPMETKTRKYLRQIFKEDIKKLERFLNKDLSHWK